MSTTKLINNIKNLDIKDQGEWVLVSPDGAVYTGNPDKLIIVLSQYHSVFNHNLLQGNDVKTG